MIQNYHLNLWQFFDNSSPSHFYNQTWVIFNKIFFSIYSRGIILNIVQTNLDNLIEIILFQVCKPNLNHLKQASPNQYHTPAEIFRTYTSIQPNIRTDIIVHFVPRKLSSPLSRNHLLLLLRRRR